MFTLLIAFLLSLTSHTHSGTNGSGSTSGQVTVMDDTGGDTGDIPPTPPPHH